MDFITRDMAALNLNDEANLTPEADHNSSLKTRLSSQESGMEIELSTPLTKNGSSSLRPMQLPSKSEAREKYGAQIQAFSSSDRHPKTTSIWWKGLIISPTLSQLRQFKGNLNRILEQIGGEEPPTNESPPSKISIE